MIFESGVYRIDVDVERTRTFYGSAPGIDCDCAGCRNFAKAAHLIPEAVQQFLSDLGIDIGKPAEMSAYYSTDGNMTYYDGFYHLCGTILEGINPWRQVEDRAFQLDEQYAIKLCEGFSIFFTDRCALIEENFPRPIIQLEFSGFAPWVLEEPNPYK